MKLEGCGATWGEGGSREVQWREIAKWLSWSEVKHFGLLWEEERDVTWAFGAKFRVEGLC